MRFKGRMELEYGFKTITLVPLVNVLLLLLLFIMLGSNFIIQPGMKVELPRVVTSEAVRPEKLEVLLTEDGQVYLDGRRADIQALRSAFSKASKANLAVLIKADRRVSLEKASLVWDLAREEGVAQVNIATNQ